MTKIIQWLKNNRVAFICIFIACLCSFFILFGFNLLPEIKNCAISFHFSWISIIVTIIFSLLFTLLYYLVRGPLRESVFHIFKRASFYLLIVIVFLVISICIFTANQWSSFDQSLPIDSSKWGEFGDFVGGTLGVILSLVSVFIITWTFKSQEKASEEQRFHDIFFEMLKLYQELVKDLLVTYVSRNQSKGEQIKITCTNKDFFSMEKDKILNKYNPNNNTINDLFLDFYYAYYDKISIYFRTIYRLYDLIQRSDIKEKSKKEYLKIVRAQFTSSELFFIRLNSCTNYGKSFRKYIIKYNVLKHICYTDLLEYPVVYEYHFKHIHSKDIINYSHLNTLQANELFCKIKKDIRHSIVENINREHQYYDQFFLNITHIDERKCNFNIGLIIDNAKIFGTKNAMIYSMFVCVLKELFIFNTERIQITQSIVANSTFFTVNTIDDKSLRQLLDWDHKN